MRPGVTAMLAASAAIVVMAVVTMTLLPSNPTPTVRSTGTALVGGPFTMVSHTGDTVTDADYQGKYLLIYFGFTYCPDVCPTRLVTVSQAMTALGRRADKVQPLFVTIDPERDTVAAVADYVSHFHPDIVGLTGTPEQVTAMADAYKVYFAKVQDDSMTDYVMDHTDILYLMGPDNDYLAHFTANAGPEEIAKAIRAHL